MGEAAKIEHRYTSEIVCPHCGHEHSDSWEMGRERDDESFETECAECEQKMTVERHYDVTYNTEIYVPPVKRKRDDPPPPDLRFLQGDLEPVAREGKIKIYGSDIGVWEESVDDKSMAMVLQCALARLDARGFQIERDPDTEKNYPSLANLQWYGKKPIRVELEGALAGALVEVELEVSLRLSGRSLEVKFYQSRFNVTHSSGGYYESDHFSRVPRSMQLVFIVEMSALVRHFMGHGYKLNEGLLSHSELKLAVRNVLNGSASRVDDPLVFFKSQWASNRERCDENGFLLPEVYTRGYPGHGLDRDGVLMRAGDVRYFYKRGRLMRANVYPSFNGQWIVKFSGEIDIVHHGSDLFSCDPTTVPRRFVPHQVRRLHSELKKALETENYPRCAALGVALNKVAAKEKR